MIIIDKAIQSIRNMGDCKGSYLLGHALYSACHHGGVSGPSLLNVSVILDRANTEIFLSLCQISRQDDYSNADQSEAIQWLQDYFSTDIINRWNHTA